MAEERFEIPLTPERPDPKSHYPRRYSTGGVSISDTDEEPILPHYLIASTNTCHEICKYGSRPASAEMGKHSTREKLVEGQSEIRKIPPVETKKVARPKPSSDRKLQVLNTPKIIKQEVKITKHTISSLKKVDVAAKAKSATALKPPAMAKSSSFPLKPSGALTGTRNSDVKIVNNAGTSKIVQKKALEVPRAKASSSPKPSFNRSASLNTKQRTVKASAPSPKNQKKEKKDETKPPNNEKVIEKTLYIIEPKPEEEGLKHSDSHVSLSSLSSCSSLSSPPLLPNEGEIAEEEEDKNLSQKLDFRRVKEVNLESDDNDSRRLRFSTGRMLENNQNVQNDMKQISFTRREVGNDDVNINYQSEHDKVVLRHQDVEEKKDAQGLYNSVIKETASKLVERKRGKVRALVGAFETVISLQESNKTFSQYY